MQLLVPLTLSNFNTFESKVSLQFRSDVRPSDTTAVKVSKKLISAFLSVRRYDLKQQFLMRFDIFTVANIHTVISEGKF
jgi:hypothetical protein